MIDTGSDLNLIKYCVNSRTWTNKNRVYNLVGITREMILTQGEIKTLINGVETHFHIVPNNFPIPQNGILGMAFLKQQGATLSVAGIDIYVGSKNIPSINHKTISLPARTKTLVELPFKENNLLAVYIRKIEAGPGIFLGESIVTRSGVQQGASPSTVLPVTYNLPSHPWT